jgi:hypothetical protein
MVGLGEVQVGGDHPAGALYRAHRRRGLWGQLDQVLAEFQR